MKIHEYQAKAILREFGVPVPRARSPRRRARPVRSPSVSAAASS
jgi:succinyl-CoA synthetase beta subunit